MKQGDAVIVQLDSGATYATLAADVPSPEARTRLVSIGGKHVRVARRLVWAVGAEGAPRPGAWS